MNHLLIDFDSKIPNFALMKISAWIKRNGHNVFLNDDSVAPDEVWLSCIFTWNRQKAFDTLNFFRIRYPNAKIHFGGTGFDFELPYGDPKRISLLPEIEVMRWMAGEEAPFCPYLKNGRCSIYPVRPMVCKLWGNGNEMPCMFGCAPKDGFISKEDSYRLLEARR